MFTGIVETIGTIRFVREDDGGVRLRIAPHAPWTDLTLGESIAVSGACLTVVAFGDGGSATAAGASDGTWFEVQLSRETIAKTAPHWRDGVEVNLERAMKASDRFGGHVVSGHVDAVGEIVSIAADPGAFVVTVTAPASMAGYLVPKGSITVDGVSLTVVDVGGPAGTRADLPASTFTLWLVPHTLQVTTLHSWSVGTTVNLEADQMAKYLERLLAVRASEVTP